MIQKHRINTNIGRDQKINVEITQNFDIMELLSLKFTQKDIFASNNCSNYGVVVGRVSANNGFGIPNAKISIFIPQNDIDADDPVISSLYPYKEINDINENGYRYNLLPERKQHGGHTPTGTFPDQQDILTREEVLEVFENYFKYTVKTNSSGDFMIWGVPIGVQILHVDIDLSDIGCFSLRPYDFIKKGYGIDNFERLYKFKSSSDIDGLPQIVTFNKSVEVYPLWGNESLCEIGITRTDFDLLDKGIKIEPVSLILLSTITDDNRDAVKRNGRIRTETGYKCNLQTTTGTIECVRQTGRNVLGSDGVTSFPELEYFKVTEVIDESGVAMVVIPMNMEYVYTNVFGEEEITNDPNKGIPTTTIARFRFGLDFNSGKVLNAKYLVPNIREFNPSRFGGNERYEYQESMISSYVFSDVFEDYLTVNVPEGVSISSTNYTQSDKDHKKDLIIGTNNNNIPEDYFYKFIYGKVYTVSSFQGTHYETDRRDAFLGIKQIRPSVDDDCAASTNYIPTNFGFKNRTKFSLILSQVLLFIQFIFTIILVKFGEVFGAFLWTIGVGFNTLGLGIAFKRLSEWFKDQAYRTQDRFTQILPLTIYPDCDECTTDDESLIIDSSYSNDYCRVSEYKVKLVAYQNSRIVRLYGHNTGSTINYLNTTGDTSFLGSEIVGDQNNIFPGDTAKDGEGLCSGATSPSYSQLLSDVNSGIITPIPPDTNNTRYYGEVYSWFDTGSTYSASGLTSFSNFVIFFDTGTENTSNQFKSGNIDSVASTYIDFTVEQWRDLTGMDYDVYWGTSNPYIDDPLYAIIRIYDRDNTKTLITNPSDIETGCDKYDKTYNENIVFGYLWSSGVTYDMTLPLSPTGSPESSVNITSYIDSPGYREYLKTTTLPPSPYGANLEGTIIGGRTSKRLPYKVAWKKIPNSTFDRKTKSGLSEFRNGVFTIIPVISGESKNLKAIQEWYRRKRIGLSFCGGVVNYSFIDNWLHGILYFFKFDTRLRWDDEGVWDLNQRRTKYPRELVFYHVFDKVFYYRSCPYYNETFTGQTFNGIQEILHPTTFYDVGVRDEFLSEICVDARIDPNSSVIRDISNTSYQDPANIVEHGINYRLDINNGDFNVDDFFSGLNYTSKIKVFDGDITQLISINCETGIEAFDLDSPHYFMYNSELMDPENTIYSSYFKGSTSNFGPTPIDLKFDNNGTFIRSSLNYRLGDYSQVVPFYLWDKGGEGFGPYSVNSDLQKWDKTEIAYMKLQRLFSIGSAGSVIPNYNMSNGEEEYLLKPMTINHVDFWFYGSYEDAMERFNVISYSPPNTTTGAAQLDGFIEGDLYLQVVSGSLKDPQSGNLYVNMNKTWLIQTNNAILKYFDDAYETFIPGTLLNYSGNKQVLSTPFLFYFGLKPEKTALDLLIKYFGNKGDFPSEPVDCPTYGVTPTPSPTPIPTLLPSPSVPVVNPWATPPIPILLISPSSWTILANGGVYSPNIITDNNSLIWNATAGEGWFSLSDNINRVGSDNFTITVGSNIGGGASGRGTLNNITITPTTSTNPSNVYFSIYQKFFSTTSDGFDPWAWNSNTPYDTVTLDSSDYDNIELTTIPNGFYVYDGAMNQLYEGYMINTFTSGGVLYVKPSSNNNPTGASGDIVVTDLDGNTINIYCEQTPRQSITPVIINNSGDSNYDLAGWGYSEIGTSMLYLNTVSQYYNSSPPPTIYDCDLSMVITIQHNAYPIQYWYPTWHSTSEGTVDVSTVTLNNTVNNIGDNITVTIVSVTPSF